MYQDLLSGIDIFDLGQNMVGWCRIRFNGPRGIGRSD